MVALRNGLRASVVAMLAASAAGCGGMQMSGDSTPAPAQARPAPPPVAMAGRWLMAQPGRGQCHMTFRAASAEAAEGTIAPEGGCPGKFFTSRKWAFDSNGLSVQDHNSQPLAQLSSDGGGRFEGQATGGGTVTLSR